MARLAVSLLGPFLATLEGHPITTFESDKVRALLAYLAVESGRPQPREKLAGLLWPDRPERAARANLSHALTFVRHAIGDRGADPPHLLATRQALQFNRAADAFVDVAAFLALTGRRDLDSLEQAADLYRGRFLEGFSLPDSSEFEEWMLLEQERLQRAAMGALGELAAEHESQGDLERALRCAWRQLELEPWWESAHRQAMRLLARSGQRDAALAQFQACTRLLAEELGAEPSAETVRLYAQIRDGRVATEPARQRPEALRLEAAPAAPLFRPAFVAREAELAWLGERLGAALAGRGQVLFVIGGAGRGKSALLHEFARRALDSSPRLLVGIGACDAYAGSGDPYLPFRQALAMLTGEAERHWAAGTLAGEHARRLWAALPLAAALVAERGPGLVGTILPARELLERARTAAEPGTPWLEAVACLAEPGCTPAAGLRQGDLLEQVAGVLLALAAHHPLLLILDDLQWADPASLSLLFHLARRIAPGRILVAGAYRPDELALGRDGGRHPLEPVVAEMGRRFGRVWLDLAEADSAGGRRFVDRYLDAQPNALDDAFRRALAQRTQGHPLFTVELVRDLAERGALVRDELGRWRVGGELDWERLPARAEAAIAERIARLPEALRRVLRVASVEGEQFTAQAVALVLQMDELELLQALHADLAGRYRLVREQGEQHCGARSLSRYRFTHLLVQQHLYRSLGEGERRLLHQRVGRALEQLYAGYLDEVAVHLVRHFAGEPEQEARYLRLAAQRAEAQLAHEEAGRALARAAELAARQAVG